MSVYKYAVAVLLAAVLGGWGATVPRATAEEGTGRPVRIYIQPLPDFYDPDVRTRAQCTMSTRAFSKVNPQLGKPIITRWGTSEHLHAVEHAVTTGNPILPPTDPAYPSIRPTHDRLINMLFYHHLRDSPLRVDTPDAADVVYVPYLVHRINLCRPPPKVEKAWRGRMETVLEPGERYNPVELGTQKAAHTYFFRHLDYFLPHLGTKPHFFVTGLVAGAWKNQLVGYDFRSIKDVHPGRPDIVFGELEPHAAKDYDPAYAVAPGVRNIVTLPYPSDHTSPLPDYDFAAAPPTVFATENFGDRSNFQKSYNRVALRKDCLARPDLCKDVSETQATGVALARLLSQGATCLQPLGDSPTRKSIYDCLGAGAVPILVQGTDFARAAFPLRAALARVGVAPEDFIGFVPFNITARQDLQIKEADRPYIHPPHDGRERAPRDPYDRRDRDPPADSHANLVAAARAKYSDEDLAAMRAAFRRVANFTLYAPAPAQLLVRTDALDAVHPADDAFTLGLKALVRTALEVYTGREYRPRSQND